MDFFEKLFYSGSMNNDLGLWGQVVDIKRTRDYRLYTYNNEIILDLYQDGASAIMGHKGGSALLHLKNAVSQGLLPTYPSIYTSRLKKALAKLYPDFSNFIIVSNFKEGQRLLSSNGPYHTLLPLSDFEETNKSVPYLIKIPLPGCGTPGAIAYHKEAPNPNCNFSDQLVSPFLLAAATRAVYDFIAFKNEVKDINFDWWDKAVGEAVCKSANLNVEIERENDKLVSDGFMRRGPYLYYLGDEKSYASRFCWALKNEVLISPNWGEPSLLPFKTTNGEQAKILKALLGPLS